MTNELYYEEILLRSEIPPLVKHPSTRQLVKWAGASGDYYEQHYDKDFAISAGLPNVIVHGQLAYSFLFQLITDWMGENSDIRKLTCSYKGLMFPGEALTCKGKITKKYIEGTEHYVECDVFIENPRMEKVVLGVAVITVQAKG